MEIETKNYEDITKRWSDDNNKIYISNKVHNN